MKKITSVFLSVTLCALLAACAVTGAQASNGGVLPDDLSSRLKSAVTIELSDGDIKISDESAAFTANDIVYYEEGKGIAYGEGSAEDAHSAEEAAAHTVVHIVKPGDYVISGKLSAGQIAVDLGEDAKKDENAKVTLILDNADITCSVAPAIIFYSVYECGDKNDAKYTVDTANAGANVVLKDGTVNTLNGSYVAKIYKEATLSEDGTKVESAKKLHKYDGALYSKMSMNIYGRTGVLNVNAENEGIDSELHLTVCGGIINIVSGNDGVNTNEDNVSVTTVNGGELTVTVNGKEGDGIDSNGWIVINGGAVRAYACGSSDDSGIDSDLGIYINGGSVTATGNMLNKIAGGEQTYALFSFGQKQTGGSEYTLKTEEGKEVATFKTANDFQYLIVSVPELLDGNYTIWQGDTQLSVSSGGGFGGGFNGQGFGGKGFGGGRPDGKGQTRDGQTPENMPTPPDGQTPENMPTPPDGQTPENMPTPPDGQTPENMPTPPGGQNGKGFGKNGFGGHNAGKNRPDGEKTDGVSETTFKAPDGQNGAKGERPERPERPEKGDRTDKTEKPERTEKPDKGDNADKTDDPQRPERTEKGERPERPERTEKGERPERPERADGKSGKTGNRNGFGGRSREYKTVFEIKSGGNTFYIA